MAAIWWVDELRANSWTGTLKEERRMKWLFSVLSFGEGLSYTILCYVISGFCIILIHWPKYVFSMQTNMVLIHVYVFRQDTTEVDSDNTSDIRHVQITSCGTCCHHTFHYSYGCNGIHCIAIWTLQTITLLLLRMKFSFKNVFGIVLTSILLSVKWI